MFWTQKTARAVQRLAARGSASGRRPLLVRSMSSRIFSSGSTRASISRGSGGDAEARPARLAVPARPVDVSAVEAQQDVHGHRHVPAAGHEDDAVVALGLRAAAPGRVDQGAVLLEESLWRLRAFWLVGLLDRVVDQPGGEERAVEEPVPVLPGRVADRGHEVARGGVAVAPPVGVEAKRAVHRPACPASARAWPASARSSSRPGSRRTCGCGTSRRATRARPSPRSRSSGGCRRGDGACRSRGGSGGRRRRAPRGRCRRRFGGRESVM